MRPHLLRLGDAPFPPLAPPPNPQGHRPQLVQWHTHVLECVGDAEWVFSTAEEYLQRRERGPVPRAASAVAPPSVSHSAGPTPGSHAATEGVLLGEDSFMERLTPRRSTVL